MVPDKRFVTQNIQQRDSYWAFSTSNNHPLLLRIHLYRLFSLLSFTYLVVRSGLYLWIAYFGLDTTSDVGYKGFFPLLRDK